MNRQLFLQLHVHSERSYDSSVPIAKYVEYLDNLDITYDHAILGITDHNVIPITMACALEYSTNRTIVIPGIQWRIRQRFRDNITKLSTRREIITLGNHDDLRRYILTHTRHSIAENDEILGHLDEQEFLGYLIAHPDLAVVIPHPKHFIVDYYGPREIAELKQKMVNQRITSPVFVEALTGCDPFPRILYQYNGETLVLGGSDAHEIEGLFGISSMLSVVTTLEVSDAFLDRYADTTDSCNVIDFDALIFRLLSIFQEKNKKILIRKNYSRSIVQLFGIAPRWVRRRFDQFPRNLLK